MIECSFLSCLSLNMIDPGRPGCWGCNLDFTSVVWGHRFSKVTSKEGKHHMSTQLLQLLLIVSNKFLSIPVQKKGDPPSHFSSSNPRSRDPGQRLSTFEGTFCSKMSILLGKILMFIYIFIMLVGKCLSFFWMFVCHRAPFGKLS